MRLGTIIVTLILAPVALAAGPQRHFTDAPLRAVQFIDRNEGWAVGDEGTIWHSIDGGATWERQLTGARGSLRSVCFINPFTGWAVGREELPNGGGSTGIVLLTTDGGLKWTRICQNTLPGLHSIKFFDDKNGIAAGEGCDAFPSGVFATADGGLTWRTIPGQRQPGWLAADFSDIRTGALAGSWSSMAIMRDSLFAKAESDALGGRAVRGLKVYRDTAFAVGEGGLILKSADSASARWSLAAPKCLSANALASCDFNAVHVLGEHVWVAGRPGSIVLHSSDYGKTWQAQATGQNLALHGMHFFDHQTGWAVGELGTILGTDDGGKTWKVQRRGGERHTSERAAVLFIHADGRTLPLDAIAHLGADEGYLAAALRVCAADSATANVKRAADPHRWNEAVRLAGGASGECLWPFSVAAHRIDQTPEKLLAALNAQQGNRAGEMMLRLLVLSIRIWRPEVIITDMDNYGPAALVDQAMRQAYTQAADPNSFPEQIEELGLKPWTVKKLYDLMSRPLKGVRTISLATTDSLPRIGDSARDLAGSAASLLYDGLDSQPTERSFGLRDSRLHDAESHLSLMQEINLAHGGTARRDLAPVSQTELNSLEERKKQAQLRRNLEALANADPKAVGGPDKLLAQLDSMLKKLPLDLGAPAAFAVASSFARAGHWPVARETFMLILERYPAHPLAVDACRWLIRYHSSSEARRRYELRQFVVTSEFKIQHANFDGPKDGPIRQTARNESTATETQTPVVTPEVRNWYQPALELESRLLAFGPLFMRDPALQFGLLSAKRSLGDAKPMQKWCEKFLADGGATNRDTWREITAAENWLTNRAQNSPRPVGMCRSTSKRPHLDGKLDDDCWTDARSMPLSGELGDAFAARALFAHDRDFLYIAVECKHPQGMQAPKVANRQRDMYLSGHDRVGIMLDLDRDFQTYYHLQIDQRGALAEDCWGDKTWNPKWFVAVDSTAAGWTAEVAIPLAELTADLIVVGKTWACNVVRVAPGKGIMSWSRPADVDPRPEGMGLLMFTEEKK